MYICRAIKLKLMKKKTAGVVLLFTFFLLLMITKVTNP